MSMANDNPRIMTYVGTELKKVERKRVGKRTPERAVAFLAALAESGQVKKAAEAVGVSAPFLYKWRDEDPSFAEAWDRAIQVAVAGMEDEARRRAVDGYDELVIHQGRVSYEMEPVKDDEGRVVLDEQGNMMMRPRLDEHGNPVPLTIKRYSDQLLTFLLRAHAPEKYRERSEIRHEVGDSLADAMRAARERLRSGSD